MGARAGVVAAACSLPGERRHVSDLFADEGLVLTAEVRERLAVDEVPVCRAERGSDLAADAARQAMALAEVTPAEVDVIIDYTVLPQEYLVPAWSMSNKLQHVLGAKKAFTVGFSGGGSTSLHFALSLASALIETERDIGLALLVAADCCIPRNRLLNPDEPQVVLGDGASALVVRRDAPRGLIVDTEIWSDGSRHDVCCIPGGAMAHPERDDLYRLRLDRAQFERSSALDTLRRLTAAVLERAGLEPADIAFHLYPNLSAEDQHAFMRAFDIPEGRICLGALRAHGHLQATDLVVNYLSAQQQGLVRAGDHVLMSSHGLGFVSGVTLLRH